MSASNSFEQAIALLIFNNTVFTGIAEPSAVAGNLFVSLHIADPGEAGAQNTSEATYTGYARIPVARSAAGWNVAAGVVNPVNNLDFGECTAGTETITHVGIGSASTGAGVLYFSGVLSSNIPVTVGTVPRIKNTSTISVD
jgi:hypothetical protein